MGAANRRRPTLALLLCAAALSLDPHLGGAGADPRVGTASTAPASEPVDPEVAVIRERIASHHTGLAAFEIAALAETIQHEGRAHRIPVSLVLGVIEIESGYYNFAVSSAGALGLMQIMPATGTALAHELGVPWNGPHTLFDPQVNVRLGIAYLGRLQRDYGKLSTALAAYNWGPARINARLRRGTPLPVRYARDVIDAYGVHAERLAARRALGASSASTRAATKPSTASMAASSLTR